MYFFVYSLQPMAKLEGLGKIHHVTASQSNKINDVKGDLFSCPSTDSLAHCISADCRMGAGIALQFKKRFKRVEELKSQSKSFSRRGAQCCLLEVLVVHKSGIFHVLLSS
ncbi:Hypothetical predicted protein [Pelobates cultripes]|uniref:O-acyl-ADP-ribose deacylase 1 n=1 Tax=Pelobates cultripes TaxID=61616 RepID=A0AAD1R0I0_PELCU|nr:Hypothetical predicted protein [Pelobates cultripes]